MSLFRKFEEVAAGQFDGRYRAERQIGPAFDETHQIQERKWAETIVGEILLMGHEDWELQR